MSGFLKYEDVYNQGYAGKNNEGLANSNTTISPSKSPVDQELHVLSGRLDSITSLIGLFVNQLTPILRADVPPDPCADQKRSAGESEVHEQLIQLNEKASDIARFIDHTIKRVTV